MDAPEVRCEEVVPTLAVGDVPAAIAWYRDVLGFEERWRWGDPPTHVGIALDHVELHLSATPPDPGANWLYFVVSDVDRLHERILAAGGSVEHAPEDQEWGMREVALRDPVGNRLTFASPGIVREPKLSVTREELSVRLESRIVAVLRSLSEHKGMDMTELLEETLLHTFEKMPHGGVASPHTRADLDRIEELKRAHGLDYDVHASYRFVEGDGSS